MPLSVPAAPPPTPRATHIVRPMNQTVMTVGRNFLRREKKRLVRVRRRAAIGDVIMASGVVRALAENGLDVSLVTQTSCAEALLHSGLTVETDGGDIVLDGAYEDHPDVRTRPKPEIFAGVVAEWCYRQRMKAPTLCNLAPKLTVTRDEKDAALATLSRFPKPWIAVGPRSNSWPQRTVQRAVWADVAEKASGFGTWLWTGTDPAPSPLVDANTRTIRGLMGVLANCDIMVCVDSGPMHLAAGLGIPLVVIEQACSPELHLSDQRDYTVISAELRCLNCHEKTCPVNAGNPPCGMISPEKIVRAVAAKMISRRLGVSAVIPVYGHPKDRLRRCLEAVLPQVDEVVVAFDGVEPPRGLPLFPRMKIVGHPSRLRRGYGKTCNYAARHTNGAYIMMLNDDVYLKPGAVQAMRDVMRADTAVVGMKLRYPDGTIQHAGTTRRPNDMGWGHIDHKKADGSIKVATEVENVTHASALIRRQAFYDAMGYDEEFDCYCEDNAFSLSVRQRGWKIIYQPAAEGIHDESQSSGEWKLQLSLAASKVFRRKWGWYFEKNRHNNMGTFV